MKWKPTLTELFEMAVTVVLLTGMLIGGLIVWLIFFN